MGWRNALSALATHNKMMYSKTANEKIKEILSVNMIVPLKYSACAEIVQNELTMDDLFL